MNRRIREVYRLQAINRVNSFYEWIPYNGKGWNEVKRNEAFSADVLLALRQTAFPVSTGTCTRRAVSFSRVGERLSGLAERLMQ